MPLAERHFSALRFGREAPKSEHKKSFDFWPHVQQTRPATICADAAALGACAQSGQQASFSAGFCFGGTISFLSGA